VVKNNLKTDFNLREQITDLRQKIYTSWRTDVEKWWIKLSKRW
jgi:hypothetical protein